VMPLARRFRFIGEIADDEIFPRVVSLSAVLFFIFLGDAILSYWVPNFLQSSLNGSSFEMGLVFSFSSLVGLFADLAFPSLLKSFTVKKLILSAGFLGIAFLGMLVLGTKLPIIWVFLSAMAIWGIYYEFLGFGSQQFVADSIPLKLRASGWAVLGTFKNLAYFLGPFLAGWLIIRGNYTLAGATGFFIVTGILILTFFGKKNERPISIEISEVNLWRELSHWRVLFARVWPIVIISIFLGLIDATFWTTGAVWMESLSKQSFWGNFLLPVYQMPALFMGFVVTKWGIYKGKKKMALRFLILACLFLMLLIFNLPIPLYILCVFVSSVMLGVTYPLVDAVYSDIVARMRRERKHLVGLSNSTSSIAYIIGPAIAGFIAGVVGSKLTFVVAGAATLVVAAVLFFVTPKKIRLPETKISSWE
jgi:MFS family permease